MLNYVLSGKDEVRAAWQGLAIPMTGYMFVKDSGQPFCMAGTLDSPLFETLPGEPLVLVLTNIKLVTGHGAYVEVDTPALTGAARVLELS